MNPNDPHAGQPVLMGGPEPADAAGALILLHGRGANAEDIVGIYEAIGLDSLLAVAPDAAGNSWYPHSFLAPLESNQPYLDSALKLIKSLIEHLQQNGIPTDKIALLGFSQGACLTSEFIARNPAKYGAALALTGGVIGPDETPRNYTGSLEGTPVLLATGDPDPHIPVNRVRETEKILTGLGANVTLKIYPGKPHSVNEDEIDICREMLQAMIGKS